nr:hypothetical protein [Tanacetum cinerariifolium]
VEVDDQAIQSILFGLPEDIYDAVDSCGTAQEIWLRVQQMMKGFDIEIQEKKAKNLVVQNAVQNLGVQNVGNQNGLIVVPGIANQNPNRNGNVVAARAEGNEIRNNDNQIRCYNCRGLANLDEIEEVNANCILMANLQQASTSDELLDKQIQLENKIKTLNNILVKTSQSIQMMHMLSPKPDSFYHTEQKMALGYQNPSYLKQAQQKQQSLYNGKVLLKKHDPPIMYDSDETLQLAQETKSREELYFLNISKTANVSKPISIPNEEFSDDTTPSVARKFLNDVKSTIVTLQCVVKQKMTLDIHNWSSSVHQEIHKIIKDESFPSVNQVDARLQNFEIQFLKEAAEFVRDFKSLAKEADESLAKHTAFELEIERLLRAVISQDIMSIVQNNSVVDASNL